MLPFSPELWTTYISVMGVVRLLHVQPMAVAALSCRGAQMSTEWSLVPGNIASLCNVDSNLGVYKVRDSACIQCMDNYCSYNAAYLANRWIDVDNEQLKSCSLNRCIANKEGFHSTLKNIIVNHSWKSMRHSTCDKVFFPGFRMNH